MRERLETASAALATIARQAPPLRLSFRLGDALFSVGASRVLAVIEHDRMRPAPGMPAFVRGMVDHGNLVVPVVDMRARLDDQACVLSCQSRVVVIEVAGEDGAHLLGVVVDAILDAPAA